MHVDIFFWSIWFFWINEQSFTCVKNKKLPILWANTPKISVSVACCVTLLEWTAVVETENIRLHIPSWLNRARFLNFELAQVQKFKIVKNGPIFFFFLSQFFFWILNVFSGGKSWKSDQSSCSTQGYGKFREKGDWGDRNAFGGFVRELWPKIGLKP